MSVSENEKWYKNSSINEYISKVLYKIHLAKLNETTIVKCIKLGYGLYEPNKVWIMLIENKFQFRRFERFIIDVGDFV